MSCLLTESSQYVLLGCIERNLWLEAWILGERNFRKEIQTLWDRNHRVVFGLVLAFALARWNRPVRNLGIDVILRKLIFARMDSSSVLTSEMNP